MAEFGPLTPITGYHANILTNRNGTVDNADAQHTHSSLPQIEIDCAAATAIGDFVYVDSADHVASVTDNTNPRILGVVVDKLSITRCKVLMSGEADVFAGLVPGSRYMISIAGALTTTPPAVAYVIPVGIAMSTTKLAVKMEIPMQRAV